MAKREQKKLTDLAVRALTKPGRYGDGGNLFLVVSKSGAKKWTFLFRWQGKLTEMGLGSLVDVSLAHARQKAIAARVQLDAGTNPVEARRAAEHGKTASPEFGAFALDLIETIKSGFRNPKHQAQWRSTLETYCRPIWKTSVDKVDTAGVLKCLTPIWNDKPETASRVRGRIERVLDAAKAQGLRSGENPAVWRGHLSATLPKPLKLSRGHHAALPYDQMPAFMKDLRTRDATAAFALEFLILTACRTGEVRGATWAEIDLERGLWTIPANRMKAGKEHRVPLSGRAKAIVQQMSDARISSYVFPGLNKGRPLSEGAFDALLERMKRETITAHGFRSAFSDWASEVSSFSSETRETALAHTISNKAEAAYRRGDALEKRRLMMEAWASWCEPRADGNILPMARVG